MAEISVIMPVYNAEKFLQAAIDSILQQTFTDFEFLICDDCSDDCSAEILQSVAVNDPRIKLLRNEKNSGVTLSLNKLLKAASAPLIARMDADDIAVPERLQWQFDFMQQHPGIAVAGGDLEIIDEGTNTLARRYYPADFNSSSPEKPGIEFWLGAIESAEYVITDSFHGTVFSLLFHKKFFTFINFFRGRDRFDMLENIFDIGSCLVNDAAVDIKEQAELDYDGIDEKLTQYRKAGEKFLQNAGF